MKKKTMIAIRVPAEILTDFDEICRQENKTRTNMLVDYMRRTTRRKRKEMTAKEYKAKTERSNTHENI